MSAWVKYESEFYSENEHTNESRWKIQIYQRSGSGSTMDFKTTSEGFTLKMDGQDDSLLAPIKTTSVSFNFIIETSNEQIITDLNTAASNNESEYCVKISKYCTETSTFRSFWYGVLLGDLTTLDDTSPHRIIKIEATDGLTQLKYKLLDTGSSGYNGDRSALNIIKICLSQITYNDSDFDFFDNSLSSFENFIAHIPFYYNKAMGSTLDGTWKNNVNHDPLALVKFNISIFQDENGKPWSYYKVLEQVLACFQLRVMMTCLWNDNIAPTASNESGRAMWFLQPPLQYHDNDNDSSYQAYQLIFYHNNDLSTDVALSYQTTFICDTADPSQKTSGSKEMFMPPLLTYKSFYDHNMFNAIACGPYSFDAATYQNTTLAGYEFSTGGDTFGGLQMELTGREDIGNVGWTYPSDEVARQRVLITGTVSIYPMDYLYTMTGGVSGYLSGQDFWDEWNEEFLYTGSGYYVAQDMNQTVFPRMGLRVYTISEVTGGAGGTTARSFWMWDSRFLWLHGSVPWMNDNGTSTGWQSDQYPDNYHGNNSTYDGIAYNMSSPNFPTDSSGVNQWGVDSGSSTYGWWVAPAPATSTDYRSIDNHFAWFSPLYHNVSMAVPNVGDTWDGDWWATTLAEGGLDFQIDMPFAILSPQIPWNRIDPSHDYGWSRISQIEVYAALKRDTVWDDPAGSAGGAEFHYACCKDWNHNKELLCRDRGIAWSYNYTNIRAYVVGALAGADSYDASYGWWLNNNGTPSDEEVQSPTIIIGDEPQFNPFADIDELDGFGGDYVGQFKIFQTADDDGSPEEGPDTQMWRTDEQGVGTSEDMKLHIKRAKQALAHRIQIKRKLELNFIDRTSVRDLERKTFSNILVWNSGDWEQNQSGADIAFMVAGGTFVAGTGQLKLTVMDCITYSKDNLVDKSFSSNG